MSPNVPHLIPKLHFQFFFLLFAAKDFSLFEILATMVPGKNDNVEKWLYDISISTTTTEIDSSFFSGFLSCIVFEEYFKRQAHPWLVFWFLIFHFIIWYTTCFWASIGNYKFSCQHVFSSRMLRNFWTQSFTLRSQACPHKVIHSQCRLYLFFNVMSISLPSHF